MDMRCPYCKKKLTIADKYRDGKVKCPNCNQSFIANPEILKPKSFDIPKPKDFVVAKPKKRFLQQIDDFFSFRSMIFPNIVRVVFALYFCVAVLLTIWCFTTELELPEVVITVLYIWGGIIGIRVVGEMLIIFFCINENLTDIRQLLKNNLKDKQKQ